MNLLASALNRKAFIAELDELLKRYDQQLLTDDGLTVCIHPEADCYYVNFRPLSYKPVVQAPGLNLEPA